MASTTGRMPSRFPVGTKFVIEALPRSKGRPQVYARHLEFPDGSKVRLPQLPAVVPLEAHPRRPRAGTRR